MYVKTVGVCSCTNLVDIFPSADLCISCVCVCMNKTRKTRVKFTSNSSCGGRAMNGNRIFGIRAPAAAGECHRWRRRQIFITSQRVYADREIISSPLRRDVPTTNRYSLRFTTEIKERVCLNSYFTRAYTGTP